MTIAPYIPPAGLSSLPRGNLLFPSSDWTSSNWFKNLANASGGQTDPLGGSTADSLALSTTNGNIYTQQNSSFNAAGLAMTFSVWIKAGTLAGTINLYIEDGAGANIVINNITPTSTWTRYSVSNLFPANATAGVFCVIDPTTSTGTSGQNILLWGAQLEVGSAPSTYSPTTTTIDPGIWAGVDSLPVVPYLPGQTPDVNKSVIWSTKVVEGPSLRQRATQLAQYPKWAFVLKYEVIRNKTTVPELAAFWEFFNSMAGRFGTFLYVDPADNFVTANSFGTGDGSTKTFQLARQVNTWTELVYGAYDPIILNNGVVASPATYTVNGGLVTFGTAPLTGHALTWTGYHYFLCRFDDDTLAVDGIMGALFSNSGLKFTSIIP